MKEKKYLIKIVYLGLFFGLFIVISLNKINRVNKTFINYLIKDFDDSTISINLFTSNLDYLINSYSFKKTNLVSRDINNKIYLYNSTREKYNDYTMVEEVTNLLKDKLTKLGINVIKEDRKPSELLHTGLSYYEITRSFIKDIMNKEKNIKYYIDLHCDTKSDQVVTINNKNYAPITFVLGLNNKNYEHNKKIVSKMNDYLSKEYPEVSKGIENNDGVDNQDLDENIILIKIGGINNNLEEFNNSTEIVALMLYHMLGEI